MERPAAHPHVGSSAHPQVPRNRAHSHWQVAPGTHTPQRTLVCHSTRNTGDCAFTAQILRRTFLYNIEANVSRVDDDVGRVFDITDVGAIMDELYIFYVDRCVFLVEVPSPGDSVLEGRVVPDVHLPLGVVEKLQLEKEDT